MQPLDLNLNSISIGSLCSGPSLCKPVQKGHRLVFPSEIWPALAESPPIQCFISIALPEHVHIV